MKLYIACPSYDGMASEGLQKSLEQSLAALPPEIEVVDFDILTGCCYLPIARNKLVRRFMDSQADTFMFIDADIGWAFPGQFVDFLQTDVEVLAGLYRYKQWDHDYPCHIFTDKDGIPIRENGLIKAAGVPTGFLKIQRKAFERMIDVYGESLEVDNPDHALQPKFAYWNFFDTEKVGRTWIGEDLNFCRYFLQAGGDIWVYPDITLHHYGQVYVIDKDGHTVLKNHSFTGNYFEFMLRRPGGSKEGPANPDGYEITDIDGWMTKVELEFLYQESSKYESVVEIGSYKGRSTHALLSGLAKKITCIDPWDVDSEVENIFSGEKEYQTFLKNVAPFQCNGRLRVIRGHSQEVAADIEPVDMVFIDGDHSYESVRRDIDLYLPKAKKMICGHDYAGWPGVIQAVNETFGDSFKLIDSIWYVEVGQ